MLKMLSRTHDKIKLRGNEREQTDAWSNRDLIPLPPSRRTWGLLEYYGYWTISSLGVATWQTPNSFLTAGLSAAQAMGVIVVGRFIIALWSLLVGWAGVKLHIGYSIQNRFSWGMRASYIPLVQRVLLNFIWNAVQCWNGGKFASVCITAIWPQFARMKNTLPSNMPTTTYEFIGFVVFWALSLPLLWIRPEKFRKPFQVSAFYTAIAMLSMMIWSLSVAKGVGPIFHTGENTAAKGWSTSWIMMSSISSYVGSNTAGMTNNSDWSRYAKNRSGYLAGTWLCVFPTGVLVCFIGLVTTAACQKIYGQIYWNPPDLMMVMMDYGNGSGKSRAAVFFLSLGFGLPTMFENIVANATAGGIDLAGMFPRYINIRRGAFITFFTAWICQPWQLINRASTLLSAFSSFSVFLAPLMGIMVADFFLVRHMKIKLSDLYKGKGCYYYSYGINWRAVPAWLAGWGPTIGGMAYSARADPTGPRILYMLFYVNFFYGFFSSFAIFYVTNLLFPPKNLGLVDEVDVFGTFTPEEARRVGCVPFRSSAVTTDWESNADPDEKSGP